MTRVFVGVLIPEGLKSPVLEVQKTLKNLPIEGKFVERENLHISLDFLGDVDETKLKEIKDRISELAKKIKSFVIEIGNLKLIPNEKRVRVIALDVNSPELEEIGKKLKQEIGGDVKPPHVTLCRIKKIIPKRNLLEEFERMNGEKIGSFKMSSIQLIASELRSEGPVYSVISEFPLG